MAKRRTVVEGLLRHSVAWTYCAIYVPIMILTCISLPRRQRERVWPAMVRWWGRMMLRIGGVALTVDEDTMRRLLENRHARVLLFNHSSTLDTFVGAAVLPPGGVLVLKSEFLYLPFIGVATWILGSIFVDRKDGDKARASLDRAVDRTRRNQLQLLIAPEGTRAKGPVMGRFKLGGFAFAQQADIPLLPVVLHRCQEFWPHGAIAPQKGTLEVTVLDEVSVKDADRDGLRTIADGVRESYIAELARVAALQPQQYSSNPE